MEPAHNWAVWDAPRRHYELMARYVHAHFQKSFAPRIEAYAAAATQQKEFAGQAAQAVQSEIDKLAARQAKTGTLNRGQLRPGEPRGAVDAAPGGRDAAVQPQLSTS